MGGGRKFIGERKNVGDREVGREKSLGKRGEEIIRKKGRGAQWGEELSRKE